MEPDEDQLAVLRARLDQAIALAPELARAARGFYLAFKTVGFSDAQALYLTAVQVLSDVTLAPPA